MSRRKARPHLTQVHLLRGRVLQDSPQVGVFEKSSLTFYVLVEPLTSEAERACAEIVSLVSSSFRRSKASITSALNKALVEAHNYIKESNHEAPFAGRRHFAVVCAVLKDRELYLGQVGSVVAYAVSAAGVKRLTSLEAGRTGRGPLGSSGELHVSLQRHILQESDLVVIGGGSLSRIISEARLRSLAAQPSELVNHLHRAGQREARVSALILSPQEVSWAPPTPTAKRARAQRPARVRQSRQTRPAASPRKRPGRRRRMVSLRAIGLVAVAVMGVLLLGAVASRIPDWWAERTRSEYIQLLERASRAREEMAAISNGTKLRQQVALAMELANKAEATGKDDGRAAALKAQLQQEQIKLDAVYPLGNPRVLFDGEAQERRGAKLSALLVPGDSVYLLVQGANRLYKVQPDSTPSVALLTPEAAPADGGDGPVLDKITWMPAMGLRQKAGLLAFNRERDLLELGPNGELKPIPLRGASEWLSFQAALGYNGNLYILDPKASQVWRYIPTDLGYDSERKGLVTSGELTDAVDFAIDGSIYVLRSSGKVMKFTAGEARPFDQEGIDKPILRPSSIFASASSNFVYVVDTGNRRIVVFNKQGRFQRQLTSSYFEAADNLSVDEQKGEIYWVGGTRLYAAPLPKAN